jgi:hypothetical protein
MAIPYWTAGFIGPSNLSNIQTVTMTSGRRVLTDLYSAGGATISGRRPDLQPTINVGDTLYMTLWNPNESPTGQFNITMRVRDYQVTYGTVAAMDTWTLYLEDAFAIAGRGRVSRTFSVNTSTSVAFEDVCDDLGITHSLAGFASFKKMSATTVTDENGLAVLQKIVNTEQGLFYATGDALTFYSRNWQSNTTFYAFGDAGGANTAYQQVQFLSMADNYATYVLITIDGGTPTVTGTGVYSYNLDSYALDATEAGYIGQYVEGALSATEAVPNTLSVMLNTETSGRTLNALTENSAVTLTLRGQTYTANIIGWTISSTPEQTRVTFQLAGTEQYNYLVLNNSVYGTLDNNRLGF